MTNHQQEGNKSEIRKDYVWSLRTINQILEQQRSAIGQVVGLAFCLSIKYARRWIYRYICMQV